MTTPARRPKIVLLTVLWGRPYLSLAFFQYLMRMRQALSVQAAFIPIVVGSEGTHGSERTAKKGGVKHYVEVPFGPLGERLYAGLARALELVPDLDGVVIVPPTEFLPEHAFKLYRRAALDGLCLSGFSDQCVLSQSNYAALYDNAEALVPGGRFYGRDAFSAVDWKLWSAEAEDMAEVLASIDARIAETPLTWTLTRGKPVKAVPITIVPDIVEFGNIAVAVGETATSLGYFDAITKYLGEEAVAEIGMLPAEPLPADPRDTVTEVEVEVEVEEPAVAEPEPLAAVLELAPKKDRKKASPKGQGGSMPKAAPAPPAEEVMLPKAAPADPA